MEHRVYIGLTKPVMFAGVPISVFCFEAGILLVSYVILALPIWVLGVLPFLHLFLVYLSSKDHNWYKVAMMKSKYFTKNRSLKKGRIRYSA